MYVGQTSKHLDFGGSNYSNDGIDFHCNNDGNLIDVPQPQLMNMIMM
jgi:hypothetical protein